MPLSMKTKKKLELLKKLEQIVPPDHVLYAKAFPIRVICRKYLAKAVERGELLSQHKKQQKEDDKARRAAEHGIRRFVSGKSRLAKALPAWATM